jgi:hypothetical protein
LKSFKGLQFKKQPKEQESELMLEFLLSLTGVHRKLRPLVASWWEATAKGEIRPQPRISWKQVCGESGSAGLNYVRPSKLAESASSLIGS